MKLLMTALSTLVGCATTIHTPLLKPTQTPVEKIQTLPPRTQPQDGSCYYVQSWSGYEDVVRTAVCRIDRSVVARHFEGFKSGVPAVCKNGSGDRKFLRGAPDQKEFPAKLSAFGLVSIGHDGAVALANQLATSNQLLNDQLIYQANDNRLLRVETVLLTPSQVRIEFSENTLDERRSVSVHGEVSVDWQDALSGETRLEEHTQYKAQDDINPHAREAWTKVQPWPCNAPAPDDELQANPPLAATLPSCQCAGPVKEPLGLAKRLKDVAPDESDLAGPQKEGGSLVP